MLICIAIYINKFKAQTLTGNPIGNYRCQLFSPLDRKQVAWLMLCLFTENPLGIYSKQKQTTSTLNIVIQNLSNSLKDIIADTGGLGNIQINDCNQDLNIT